MTATWTPPARVLAELDLLLTGAWPEGRPFEPGVPDDLAGGPVDLLDPEGVPLARHDPVTGTTTPLGRLDHGPFRRLHRTPAEVHAALGTTEPQVLLLTWPPDEDDVRTLRRAADAGPLVVLVCAGPRPGGDVSAVALVRCALAVTPDLPHVLVVAASVSGETALRRGVAERYGRPVAELEGGGDLPAPVRRIVDADRPPPDRRGLVVLLTGLSGSGKSTIARALHDRLLERTARTVSTLDGDVVRHHLSRGLGFSREDRETNIERIGWVAAEVARHHGVAICSPIAPFATTRATVRSYVEQAGGTFALVHVATPLEECERRDRKGLYARARAGEIPDFTGISSPYEEPDDALVRVDTTGRDVTACLDDVLEALVAQGVLAVDVLEPPAR